ncbi:MAG: hypothetical protein IJS96_08920 [Schwartzia sp.]|nr:hypothetical protein [Schwartzia sp. (in: firmicutes)]
MKDIVIIHRLKDGTIIDKEHGFPDTPECREAWRKVFKILAEEKLAKKLKEEMDAV